MRYCVPFTSDLTNGVVITSPVALADPDKFVVDVSVFTPPLMLNIFTDGLAGVDTHGVVVRLYAICSSSPWYNGDSFTSLSSDFILYPPE